MMQIIQSQNAPLEEKQTNLKSQASTNNKSINESVNTQTSMQPNSSLKDKASGTLQSDVVSIGNEKASVPLTYDIKTMTRQADTTYEITGGHTGDNPAAAKTGDNDTVTTSITGGHTGDDPSAANTSEDNEKEENSVIKPAITGGHTGDDPA